MVPLTSKLIQSLTQLFLLSRYDNPKPTPEFHKELWEECCSSDPWVAMAAPRGHAKSTSVTHAYTLASILFRNAHHVLIISDTEKQAVDFLGDIKMELQENEALKEQFEVKKFLKDAETEIIVQFKDGDKFRIIVKGSEQKVRGIKWRGMRPDLIIFDDFENDEMVASPDRREKSRNWFQNALLPCGSDDCLVRGVGTILHLDSQLNRLMDSSAWRTKLFEAHNPDFSEILWPEKFPKERLLRIRAAYEEDGNLDGYAKEYLNNPVAEGNTYFRPQDFLEMDAPDHEKHMIYFAAADFAISEKERADYTVIMVAGIDADGMIYIVDVRRGRWDSKKIVDELLSVQQGYSPETFIFETEKIDKAIGPYLDDAMRKGTDLHPPGLFINIVKMTPTKSKTQRGTSIQAKMKSQSIKFDKEADWYPAMYTELMTMTPSGPRGKHDDFFDAFAYIGLGIKEYYNAPTAKELEDEIWENEYGDDIMAGVCMSTGY